MEACTDPDAYRAGLRREGIDLALICSGRFEARLARVELRHLNLLHGHENLARVAHLKLSPKLAFVTFTSNRKSSMNWAGVNLQPGDIVFHSHGEQMYQRTTRACSWGSVSLTPECLAAYGRALVEQDLAPPPSGRVMRPSPSAAARLRRLHERACHLAETNPGLIAHPEVARSLDQDLVHALVTCLAAGDVVADTPAHQRHVQIMTRFEELLVGTPAVRMPVPELCKALGVAERSLRLCCAEFLGMGPNRYRRLQQMNAVRTALRHADPATHCVADVASRHGFSDLGRFAAAYRFLFGEKPSDTLRRRVARPGSYEFAEFA